MIFLAISKSIWALQARYMVILPLTWVTWIIKPFLIGFNAAAANFFQSIIYTCLVITRTFANVYNCQVSSLFTKNTFILLKVRKKMPIITATVVLTTRKVSWKNRSQISLSLNWKLAKTKSNVLTVKPLIFKAPILMDWTLRPSLAAEAGVITLTSLSESIKVYILAQSFLNGSG